MSDSIREALAAYAHEAWASWMTYLFKHGAQNKDGTFSINASQVERWRRQMHTPYADLTEDEKESDRQEADKILAIIDADSTTISGAAQAGRIAALEAQLLAAQQANTRLIGRIVELEHERDQALTTIRIARQRLYDAHGRSSHETYLVILAVGRILRRDDEAAPPRAVTPGRLCDACGRPLVSAHIADETVITDGTRRAHVHHVCMSAYPGWTIVARARGGV